VTYCYDLHATILHLMGIDHKRLTYRYAGRDYQLTDTGGNPSHLSTIQSVYRASGERRACPVPKQKMTYAPRDPAGTTDNTTLATSAPF
jgi:hypothetical protein